MKFRKLIEIMRETGLNVLESHSSTQIFET